jgi:hypothetical protein
MIATRQALSLGFYIPVSSRSGIASCCHCGYLISVVDAQIRAFREVLSEQPVGVLVRAALPGAYWIAEVDLEFRINLETDCAKITKACLGWLKFKSWK